MEELGIEKGISKHWTPKVEEHYKRLLDSCQNLAERHIIMTILGLLKYDGRSKEGKRAIAQARLRIIFATDKELWEIAEIENMMCCYGSNESIAETFERLKKQQAILKARGVKRSELEW